VAGCERAGLRTNLNRRRPFAPLGDFPRKRLTPRIPPTAAICMLRNAPTFSGAPDHRTHRAPRPRSYMRRGRQRRRGNTTFALACGRFANLRNPVLPPDIRRRGTALPFTCCSKCSARRAGPEYFCPETHTRSILQIMLLTKKSHVSDRFRRSLPATDNLRIPSPAMIFEGCRGWPEQCTPSYPRAPKDVADFAVSPFPARAAHGRLGASPRAANAIVANG
jgi:hypothetical protein